MHAEQVLFAIFGIATVASAASVIFLKNPIGSAMALVATFFFLAGIYVLLWAHTVAALQVLVYAGAIMVLFLFVIMLLSLQESGPTVRLSPSRVLGTISTIALLGALWLALKNLPAGDLAWAKNPEALQSFGSIQSVGAIMYTRWLFPFEAVSLLLLVAIVGAVVVAKARI